MKTGTTLKNHKLIALAIVFLLTFSIALSPATAQDDSKFSLDVSLNSDIFFGFYPFFAGSYALSDNSAFTFYGILWSGGNNSAGLGGGAWGNWTEFGVGVNFDVGEGLSINPQIGLLNGSLTSGLGTPVLGEGIVPNLTIGADYDAFEGEIYLGLYTGIDHGNPNTNNYLHYWVNAGPKIGSFFSAGLHLEHLRFMGGKNYDSDAAYDYFVSFGPYVQFADPAGKGFVRFTSGWDLRGDDEVAKSEYEQPSFFKLTVGMSF